MNTILKIQGNPVECVSLSEIAKLSGKRSATLRKWEQCGWIPKANFRTQPIPLKSGKKRVGYRLYTKEIAIQMAVVIQRVEKGVKIPNEVIRKLHELSKTERQKYLTNASDKKESRING